ncbi:MAG: hypothetical protein R3E14_12235 [Erythrobacter sp.]
MGIVESIMRQKGVAVSSDKTDLGQLRFRRTHSQKSHEWNVELLGSGPLRLDALAA